MVADNDGVIETGENVYLFFGMGRGGDFYYALDVSDRTRRQLKWRIDGATLTGSARRGRRRRPPKSTSTASSIWRVVIGGGYEADQDSANLTTDTIGNSIYIVDSDDRRPALARRPRRHARELRRRRARDGLFDPGSYPRRRHRRRRPRRSDVRRRHGRPGVALRHPQRQRRRRLSSPAASSRSSAGRRPRRRPRKTFAGSTTPRTSRSSTRRTATSSTSASAPATAAIRSSLSVEDRVLRAPRLRHGSDDAGPVRLAADHRARRPRRR